jgi:hypothetical protein
MNLSTVIIVITFVTSILIKSSSQISFAKKNDKEEDDDDEKNLTEVQNDILNNHYPNQYYFCGYPQQLITDYNFFEKFHCK